MSAQPFDYWPKDANELLTRLKGWWSLNNWLLDDGADHIVNQTPEQIITYLRQRAEDYKIEAKGWRERAIRAERALAEWESKS